MEDNMLNQLRQEAFDYLLTSSDWINKWTDERLAEMDLYELLEVLGYSKISDYIRENK